jgi:hypothetical protein
VDHQIATALLVDRAGADTGVAFTPAVETGGKTGVRIQVTAIYAPVTIALTAEVQHSVDMMNWSTALLTTPSLTTAPGTTSAETNSTATMPLGGYVRVKFTEGNTRVVVSATLSFFDFNG